MRKSLLILTTAIFLLLNISSIYACEATLPLGIEKTVEQADLVIIGQKVGEGPIGETEYPFGGEPIWVDIKIIEILKGNSDLNPIRINTNSICGYGFHAPSDEGIYIMFFKWDNQSESFKRVREAGETLLKLANNMVSYTEQDPEGIYKQKSENIAEFIQKFGLTQVGVEDLSIPKEHTPKINLYYVIGSIVILALLLFLVLRRRKK